VLVSVDCMRLPARKTPNSLSSCKAIQTLSKLTAPRYNTAPRTFYDLTSSPATTMAKKKAAPATETLTWAERELIDDNIDKKTCLRCKSIKHRSVTCPRTKPATWGELLARKSAGKKTAGKKTAVNDYILEKQKEFWNKLSEEERKKKGPGPPWEMYGVEDSDEKREVETNDPPPPTPGANDQGTQATNTDAKGKEKTQAPVFESFSDTIDALAEYPRDFPRRNGVFAKTHSTIATNHFGLQLQPNTRLYEYQLQVSSGELNKKKTRESMQDAIDSIPYLKKEQLASDNVSTIISWTNLHRSIPSQYLREPSSEMNSVGAVWSPLEVTRRDASKAYAKLRFTREIEYQELLKHV
jgi:hypothetical protein